MPKKKKLVPNSGKSISEIQQLPGNNYTENGVSSLAFLKFYEYFKDINCIYSEEYPEGKMLELLHIVLYCRFKSFQNNGKKCYESQGRLGQLFKSDAGTIGDKIEELVKMGLVRKDLNPDKKFDTLIYTALEITDAHVIPPDQLSTVPIIVSDEVPHQPATIPAPEPKKATDKHTSSLEALSKLIIDKRHSRTGGATFIEFARSLAQRERIMLPPGIEFYFKQHHPTFYDDFEIPF